MIQTMGSNNPKCFRLGYKADSSDCLVCDWKKQCSSRDIHVDRSWLKGRDPAIPIDMVNHPPHYTQYRVEVIDLIEDATKGLPGFHGYLLGNVIKYLLRYPFKGGVEDLKKGRFYLDRLIGLMEEPSDGTK